MVRTRGSTARWGGSSRRVVRPPPSRLPPEDGRGSPGKPPSPGCRAYVRSPVARRGFDRPAGGRAYSFRAFERASAGPSESNPPTRERSNSRYCGRASSKGTGGRRTELGRYGGEPSRFRHRRRRLDSFPPVRNRRLRSTREVTTGRGAGRGGRDREAAEGRNSSPAPPRTLRQRGSVKQLARGLGADLNLRLRAQEVK
jgi:hypothetical protein